MKKSIILYFIIGAEAVIITLLLFQYVKNNSNDISTEVSILDPGFRVQSTEPALTASETVTEAKTQLSEITTVTCITTVPETTTAPVSSTSDISDDDTSDEEKPEKIIIHDNGNTAVEYPYIDAPLNNYDFSGLVTEDRKRKMYYEEGEKKALFGIDVSQYQGDVDWNRVRDDGVEFVIARAGYRGYETGKLNADKRFLEYASGVKNAGMKLGVYYYSQAVNAAEASEEADFVIKLLEDNNITPDMPVVFDWEFVLDEDPARTDGLDKDILNECCEAFCSKVSEKGYDTLYYTNIKDALFRYDMNRLSKYGMWLAEYSGATDFVYDFKMWQYSCSGLIDGIESLVDLNLWFQ